MSIVDVKLLSRTEAGDIIGRDGKPWYRILRKDANGLLGTLDHQPGNVALTVEFPDGGVEPRSVPDQEVQVFSRQTWDLPGTDYDSWYKEVHESAGELAQTERDAEASEEDGE